MGKARLLVVEDDIDIGNMLKIYFGGMDFDVDVAVRGSDALERTKQVLPHLIVLDIMLPDINGKEVCQRVRSDSTLEAVKIICISGMVEQDKVADLRAAGADDFVQKPFTVDKLMERACDLLELERPVTT